jgi:ribosome-binding factor A
VGLDIEGDWNLPLLANAAEMSGALLSLVLSGECSDEVLQNLEIVAVDPAPNASQLLVTVRSTEAAEAIDPAEVSTRLASIAGRLRCEVASAITRKRAPKLVFRVV